MRGLSILGARSFARVVAATAMELGIEIAGFVVDDEFYEPHVIVINRWTRAASGIQRVPYGMARDHPFVVGIVSPERGGLYQHIYYHQTFLGIVQKNMEAH